MNPNRKIKANHFNKQPAWFNALNMIWKGTYPLGTKTKLEKDDLIKTARKVSKLHDFGQYVLGRAIGQNANLIK